MSMNMKERALARKSATVGFTVAMIVALVVVAVSGLIPTLLWWFAAISLALSLWIAPRVKRSVKWVLRSLFEGVTYLVQWVGRGFGYVGLGLMAGAEKARKFEFSKTAPAWGSPELKQHNPPERARLDDMLV